MPENSPLDKFMATPGRIADLFKGLFGLQEPPTPYKPLVPPKPQIPETERLLAGCQYTSGAGETAYGIAGKLIEDNKLVVPETVKRSTIASDPYAQQATHTMAVALVIASKNGMDKITPLGEGKKLVMPTQDEITDAITRMSQSGGILADGQITLKETQGRTASELVGLPQKPNAGKGRG